MTSATINVAHPFEVESQAKVAAVIGGQDVNYLAGRRIDGSSDPETWPDLKN